MRKGLLQAVVAMVLLAACKNDKMQNAFAAEDEAEEDSIEAYVGDTLHLFDEVEEPPVAVDELFVDFFYNFAGDLRFQRHRIVFPLICREDDDTTTIAQQEWAEVNRFGEQEFYAMIYEREQDLELQNDTAVQSVSVEWIYLQEDYTERLNFHRINGQWMLTDILKGRTSNMPNSDFLRFYGQFVADSTFQHESLDLPLRLTLTSEDGEEAAEEETLSAEDWFNMREELPIPHDELVHLDYGQTSISQNRKTLLMQGLGNGLQMKFLFNKDGENWKLIAIEY